nr:cystathionine gamma-synthase family protein [Pelagibacterales bacterium]
MPEKKVIGQSTKSIWSGEQEYELYERSTQVPVVHSVSFGYKDVDTWHKAALGVVEGHIYSR